MHQRSVFRQKPCMTKHAADQYFGQSCCGQKEELPKAIQFQIVRFFHLAAKYDISSTASAAGIMTNYSISYSEDGSLGELMGGAYSKYKFDLLKEGGFNGFIISDWGVWDDWDGTVNGGMGRGDWGTEDWTPAERLAYSIQLGMCQAGGFNKMDIMQEAWGLLVAELGEEAALSLVRERATTILTLYMNLGLFDNPYRSVAEAEAICWSEESMAYGLETQLHSVVMLKNDGTIANREGADKLTVYIPYLFTAGQATRRGYNAATYEPGFDLETAEKYFNVVTDTLGDPTGQTPEGNPEYKPEDVIRASAEDVAGCDMVLIHMYAPFTGGTAVDNEDGSVTFFPASLQYAEYTAENAKDPSVAQKVYIEEIEDIYMTQTVEVKQNRSYKGNSAGPDANISHLDMMADAVELAGDVPVVVAMSSHGGSGSMVWTEVEPYADAILWAYDNFENFSEALLMTAAGLAEPEGLLVVQMPASMDAVEAQADDLVRDTEVYVDANGNAYDFAFGMNWDGVIDDERVSIYSTEPLTECEYFDFFYAN